MFEGDSEESRLDCLGQDKEYKERLKTYILRGVHVPECSGIEVSHR